MRRPFCVVLLFSSMVSLAAADLFEWPVKREIPRGLIKLIDDALWVYSPKELQLERLDLSGRSLFKLRLDRVPDLCLDAMNPPCDYVVDATGTIGLLGACYDVDTKQPYAYLARFDVSGQFIEQRKIYKFVAVSKAVATADGRIALLGFDEEALALERACCRATAPPRKIALVHLLNSDGTRNSRGALIPAPASREDWKELRDCLGQGPFAIDPAGNKFLQTKPGHLTCVSTSTEIFETPFPPTDQEFQFLDRVVLSKERGILVGLLEGRSEVTDDAARAAGASAIVDQELRICSWEPAGLQDLRRERVKAELLGETNDGRLIIARQEEGRIVFSTADLGQAQTQPTNPTNGPE
jgi:hypothetical protein